MIYRSLLILIVLVLSTFSCGIYSFSGASISSEVKSINVKQFINSSSLAPTVLANSLTDQLKNKFLLETNLIPTNSDGDLVFSGQITNYSINPIAIQTDETASKNRLSMTIKVKFINIRDKESNYNKTFRPHHIIPFVVPPL